MTGRVVPVIAAVAIMTGCTTNQADSETETLKLGLARVETKCGLKPGTLRLEAGSSVTVRPAPDAEYETLDCMARELKKPEFADHIKLGFVGNEAYAAEEQK